MQRDNTLALMLFLALLCLPPCAYPAADETEISTEDFAPPISQIATHEFWLTRNYEEGVTNRLLTEYVGDFALGGPFSVKVDGTLSFLQQTGVSLLGGELAWAFDSLHSQITLGLQREHWSDWKVSENRAELFWTFGPWHWLKLSAGWGFRAPTFGAPSFWQSFAWPGDAAEFTFLYSIDWTCFRYDNWSAHLIIGNYERMRLYTTDNTHFSLEGDYQIAPQWSALGYASVGWTGFSGAIIELSQTIFGLGLRYEL